MEGEEGEEREEWGTGRAVVGSSGRSRGRSRGREQRGWLAVCLVVLWAQQRGDGGGCGAGHCASGAGAVGSHHARYFLAPPTVHWPSDDAVVFSRAQ